MPDTVASSFDIAGRPRGFMPRSVYLTGMVLASSALPLLIWWLEVRRVRQGKLKVPNAGHWLSLPHRDATLRFMRACMAAASIALSVFMGYVSWLVAAANPHPPLAVAAALDTTRFVIGLGVFLAFVLVWVIVFFARFAGRR